MSAEVKTNLVAMHQRKLFEESERRAAEPRVWRRIAHHDQRAGAGAHSFPRLAGNLPPAMRGSRDRGGS